MNSEIVFRRAAGKNVSDNDENHKQAIINSTFKRHFNTSVLNNDNNEHGRKFEKIAVSGVLIATAIGGAVAYYACKLFIFNFFK